MRALLELRSLPNLLSISRLALAAAFVFFDDVDARLVIVMVAGATDFLDGWIARQFGGIESLLLSKPAFLALIVGLVIERVWFP